MKLGPEMMKNNRELFTDLSRWLITSGGMWIYWFGLTWAGFALLERAFGVEDAAMTQQMIRGGFRLALIGGGLLAINQSIRLNNPNKKKTKAEPEKN